MFDNNYYNKKRNLEQHPTIEEWKDFKIRVVCLGIMGTLANILFTFSILWR